MQISRTPTSVVVLAIASLLAPIADAQVGGIPAAKLVLGPTDASGTATQLAALGYKPATDTSPAVLWTATTGNGTSIRRITDFDSPTRTIDTVINLTPWQNWQQDVVNNPTGASLGQPVSMGLVLNPYQVGDNAPYTVAAITDQAGAVKIGSTTRYDLTKRVYSYNLGLGSPSASDGNAGYGLFSAKATVAQLYAASGATTTPSMTVSQPVWASDGKSVYYADSSAGAVGGVWRVDMVNGGATQVIKDGTRDANDIGSRPIDTNGDGVADADRLVLSGSANYGGAGSLVSADVAYNAAALPAAPTVLLTADQIRTFLRGSAAVNYTINKVLVDGSDTFLDVSGGTTPSAGADPSTGTRRSALLRLDSQGRLSKVISYAERRVAFATGATAANTLTEKHFVRTATYNDGVNPARQVRQIDFADRTLAQVEGAWVFDVGDFNQDGVVDDADMALFRAPGVLQPLGSTATTDVSKFKFDLDAGYLADTRSTGSGGTTPAVTVDYYDVKQLQKFYAFPDGDANFDRTVNFNDLVTLAQNYGQTGRVWTQGEFTGDATGTVDFNDLVVLAQNYGSSTAPLTGFSSAFAADWTLARSLVPEPTTVAVSMSAASALMIRRRTQI